MTSSRDAYLTADFPRLTWQRGLALSAIGNGATIASVVALLVCGVDEALGTGGDILFPVIVIFVSPGLCLGIAVLSGLLAVLTDDERARTCHIANAKGAGVALIVAAVVIVVCVVRFVAALE